MNAETPSSPAPPLNPSPQAPERETVKRREIDHIARQMEGLSKRLKRLLKEAT